MKRWQSSLRSVACSAWARLLAKVYEATCKGTDRNYVRIAAANALAEKAGLHLRRSGIDHPGQQNQAILSCRIATAKKSAV
jgi:hypothetical protein